MVAVNLELRLLGRFEAVKDGAPVTDFESDSARAVLAYLACEPGRVFSRAIIAEMLWPDRPQGAALSNLRHVLSVLRRTLGDTGHGPGLIVSDRHTVGIPDPSAVWVDLLELESVAASPLDEPGSIERWRRAADLWRGPFLEGLNVRAGAEWDEWVMVTGERAGRQLVSVLRRLSDHYQRSGEFDRALVGARRLLDVSPWDERDHRRVMRLLAAAGDSAAAIAHYETFVDRLRDEVATVPAPQTTVLVDRIRAGQMAVTTEVEVSYPSFLAGAKPPRRPLFVGRESELDRLATHVEVATSGRGRVVLVEGESGSGKTMLAGESCRRAIAELSGLLVGRGRCNAYAGVGDPYLPFRELMGQLTGDVRAALEAGLIDREAAIRMWEGIPLSVRLVVERGPTLLGVMLNPVAVLDRAEQAIPGADWLEALRSRVKAITEPAPSPERMQPGLFDECTSVLAGLTAMHPLVLVVDDLQWADRGSIALLWHLARRLEGMRMLLLCLYRPEEITTRDGEPHALVPVLSELRAMDATSTITLGPDRDFVDAFVDSEPNHLDKEFRARLFSFAGGNPLYTTEVVRDMQDRGAIRRTGAGLWTTSDSLDWDYLPDRVEAVVGRRIERLPIDLQRDLEVAAVQGEEFIDETVAAVRGDPQVPARLGAESASPQALIDPAAVTRVEGRMASRHRFRHILIQRYLYGRLDAAERMRLHEATARGLEHLYCDHPEPPVVDLAHHFDAAGLLDPAIQYLHRAGQRAYVMSANQEAIQLLQRARTLLAELPASPERDVRELALLATLVNPLMHVQGYVGPDVAPVGIRLRELCDRVEPTPLVAMALSGLSRFLGLRARFAESEAVAREVQEMAEAIDAPGLGMAAAYVLGYNLLWMGEVDAGHEWLRRAWTAYDPARDAALKHTIGTDPFSEALVWDGISTWYRGYPDQATAMAERAVAWATDLDHPYTLCHVLSAGSSVRQECGDHSGSLPWAEEAAELAAREHFPFWVHSANIHRGVAVGHLGDPERGIDLIERALEAWRAMGVTAFESWYTCDLAMLDRRLGVAERGVARCELAIAAAEASGTGFAEVRAHVTRAILLADGEPEVGVEALGEAIVLSRSCRARWLELQAATEMALLLRGMGRRSEAGDVLTPVVEWFTEGSAASHLIRARRVLAGLGAT